MSLAEPPSSWEREVPQQGWSRSRPLLLTSHAPGYCRSWDLNKICYKSGVPLIENGMIERVSLLHCSLRQGRGGALSAVGEVVGVE